VIVDDLSIRWSNSPARPLETDAPLHVDSNAELSLPVSLEGFKAIAPQRSQIIDAGRRIENLKPPVRLRRKTLELANVVSRSERGRPVIPEALNHCKARQ
jgi:hypothetical protein